MALFVCIILYPVTIVYIVIVIVNNLRPTLTITTPSNVIPNKLIPPLIINNPITLLQLLILLSLLKVIPISL